MKLIDRILPINGADATRLARELAQHEGIFVGISTGATLTGALELCDAAPAGANILCMPPDTGERYLASRCSMASARTCPPKNWRFRARR